MNKELKAEKLKEDIGNWVSQHTGVIKVAEDTYEVATTQIDSYGDTVYCFITKVGDYYEVSDDGRLLFKLDPGETNPELYETGEEIALGAGFDFDDETCSISVTTDEENLAQATIRLAQLQVAISYLG